MGRLALSSVLLPRAVGLTNIGCGLEATAGYTKATNLTIVVWSIYPVVWILAEGSSIISTDGEITFHTVLDIIAKSGVNSRAALEQALSPEFTTNDDTPMIPVDSA